MSDYRYSPSERQFIFDHVGKTALQYAKWVRGDLRFHNKPTLCFRGTFDPIADVLEILEANAKERSMRKVDEQVLEYMRTHPHVSSHALMRVAHAFRHAIAQLEAEGFLKQMVAEQN